MSTLLRVATGTADADAARPPADMLEKDPLHMGVACTTACTTDGSGGGSLTKMPSAAVRRKTNKEPP